MIIPAISAINSGARINATTRVRSVSRDEAPLTADSIEEFEEIVLLRKRPRSSQPGKQAIKAGGSPATRSSRGVQEQINLLKLGG